MNPNQNHRCNRPNHRSSEPAVAQSHLRDIGLDAAKLDSVAVRQVVHGGEANVEAGCRMVNGQNVDGLAVVASRPARAAVGRVPAADGLGAADVGEPRNVSLLLPVTPYQPCRSCGIHALR